MGTCVRLFRRLRGGIWLAVGLAATACPVSARSPVVVELFTSQGCASCVKAGELVAELAARPRIIALTFDVDYWDYLGWQDTFARSEFADRQRAYLKPLGVHDVYTPEVVVNGRRETPAVDPQAVDKLIQDAQHGVQDPPQIIVRKKTLAVGAGPAPKGGGEVWLIRYDPREQSVAVKKGETRGAVVVERNVVRELIRLGAWRGRPKTFRLPETEDASLTSVALVQGAHGGAIIAARKLQ